MSKKQAKAKTPVRINLLDATMSQLGTAYNKLFGTWDESLTKHRMATALRQKGVKYLTDSNGWVDYVRG